MSEDDPAMAGGELVVAIAQMLVGPEKAANLEVIQRLARRAAQAGAELVVFPEAAMISPDAVQSGRDREAEPLDGPFVRALIACARANQIAIVAGIFEVSGGDRPYNTLIALDAGGRALGSYHKTHLYDAFGYRESDRIQAGSGELLAFEVKGMRVGLLTCYEVRLPELALEHVRLGADALIVPAAWVRGRLKEMQWELLLRARAVEGGVYVIGCGQAGGPFIGASMCADPSGIVSCCAGEGEEVLLATLSRARLEAVRARLPELAQRRQAVPS
ncbi:MAG TPA: carbon-nitrogen hydrolase family protein [Candidatus Dormibacteraeota bacterium]|nr:carbon-nitrogen hydrolase family protein [Candidatus Dormibacteraeota bacterium]